MFFDVDNVLGIKLLQWNMEYDNYNGIWVIEIKDETQLRIEFLPPNNDSKKCLKKSLNSFVYIVTYRNQLEVALLKLDVCFEIRRERFLWIQQRNWNDGKNLPHNANLLINIA